MLDDVSIVPVEKQTTFHFYRNQYLNTQVKLKDINTREKCPRTLFEHHKFLEKKSKLELKPKIRYFVEKSGFLEILAGCFENLSTWFWWKYHKKRVKIFWFKIMKINGHLNFIWSSLDLVCFLNCPKINFKVSWCQYKAKLWVVWGQLEVIWTFIFQEIHILEKSKCRCRYYQGIHFPQILEEKIFRNLITLMFAMRLIWMLVNTRSVIQGLSLSPVRFLICKRRQSVIRSVGDLWLSLESVVKFCQAKSLSNIQFIHQEKANQHQHGLLLTDKFFHLMLIFMKWSFPQARFR